MPQHIQAPDGSVIEFPDGMNDAAISAVMAKEYPAAAPANTVAGPQKAGYGFPAVAPKQPVRGGMGMDIANSAMVGFNESTAGMGDMMAHASLIPGPGDLMRYGLPAAAAIGDRLNLPILSQTAKTFQGAQAYKPQTTAGEIARTAGQIAPAVLVGGGGVLSKVANIVVPTITTELAGRGARALGAPQGVVDLARAAGGIGGGVAANARLAPRGAPLDPALQALTGKQAPDAMATRAAEMRSAGVEPTLADLVDDSGRGVIRAAASKMTPGRQAATNYRDTLAADVKPSAMAKARGLSPDPRTADELAAALAEARASEATTKYKAPYETPVPVGPDLLKALSDAPGKAALQRARSAAVARMDQARVAEIDSLLSPEPPASISAATLDRSRIAMSERAKNAGMRGANDLASGLGQRAGMIDQTLEQVPGLGEARSAYRAKTQAIDVLGKDAKDVFSTDPADYAAWHSGLGPEAKAANAVRIRQDIIDQLGGQRSGSMGSLDTLSTSQYARKNLTTALGPDANKFLGYVGARLTALRNANDIAPRTGSQTASRLQDAAATGSTALKLGVKVAHSDVLGVASTALDWLKSRGISDKTAEKVVRLSTDPTQVDQAIELLRSRYGANTAQGFKRLTLDSSTLRGLNAGSWNQPPPRP
jgi:hypothetical protein